MSEKARKHTQERDTWLIRCLKLPFKIILFLVAGIVFSIIVEWIGMAVVWKDHNHAKSMLNAEIGYLSRDFGQWVADYKPSSMAKYVANNTQKTVLNTLKFKQIIGFAQRHSRWVYNALVAAVYTAETFMVRVMVCLLSLPAFFILGVIGLVEGLVQRDLRRMGGGLEHAFLYHLAKRGLKWPIILSLLIYLSSPVSLHPNLIFVPAALWFAFGIMWTTSLFKKYL